MKSQKLLLIAMFLLANVLGLTSLAYAGSVRMEFNDEMDRDDDPPTGTPPWLVATFEDNGPDAVLLTIESMMQAPDESIKRLWFNTNDNINADNLNIVQREGGPTVLSSEAVQDGFGGVNQKGQQISGFDMQLKWNVHEFDFNDIVQFDISGSGLTAESFNFFNNTGDAFFLAVAKISDVPDQSNEHNGQPHDEFITPAGVPVPATLWLGVIGLLAMPILISRWGRLTA